MRSQKCIMKLFAAVVLSMLFCSITITVAAPIYPSNEAGNRVCLFESGTKDVSNAIAVHDTLVVYRFSDDKWEQTGKIEVIGYNGKYNISGIIIDGVVDINDIAKKNDVACMIISIGKPC